MNCHGGCARNARLKQAIDRVPKLKVIDPKADWSSDVCSSDLTSIPIPTRTRMTTTTPIRIPTAIPRPRPF